MTKTRPTGVAGAAFAVLLFVTASVIHFDPGFLADPDEIITLFTEDSGKALMFAQLSALTVMALVWFGLRLREHLVDAGEDSLGTAAAVGAGAADTAFGLSAAAIGAGALRGDDTGIGVETAVGLYDLGMVAYGGIAMFLLAVPVAAVGIAAVRGVLPVTKPFGWISLVLAVALLALPINFLGIFAVPVWALVLGVWLAVQDSEADVATPQRVTAGTAA